MSTENAPQLTPEEIERESVGRKVVAVQAVFAALAQLTNEERLCVLGAAGAIFAIRKP